MTDPERLWATPATRPPLTLAPHHKEKRTEDPGPLVTPFVQHIYGPPTLHQILCLVLEILGELCLRCVYLSVCLSHSWKLAMFKYEQQQLLWANL